MRGAAIAAGLCAIAAIGLNVARAHAQTQTRAPTDRRTVILLGSPARGGLATRLEAELAAAGLGARRPKTPQLRSATEAHAAAAAAIAAGADGVIWVRPDSRGTEVWVRDVAAGSPIRRQSITAPDAQRATPEGAAAVIALRTVESVRASLLRLSPAAAPEAEGSTASEPSRQPETRPAASAEPTLQERTTGARATAERATGGRATAERPTGERPTATTAAAKSSDDRTRDDGRDPSNDAEGDLESSDEGDGAPPVRTDALVAARAAREPPPAPRATTPSTAEICAAPAAVAAERGRSPSIAGALTVRVRAGARIGFELLALAPLMRTELGRPGETASVTSALLGAGVYHRLLQHGWLVADAALLAAVATIRTSGAADAPLVGRTDATIVGAVLLRAGAGARVTDWLTLRADLLGGAVAPRPVVAFADAEQARWRRALLVGLAGLQIAW